MEVFKLTDRHARTPKRVIKAFCISLLGRPSTKPTIFKKTPLSINHGGNGSFADKRISGGSCSTHQHTHQPCLGLANPSATTLLGQKSKMQHKKEKGRCTVRRNLISSDFTHRQAAAEIHEELLDGLAYWAFVSVNFCFIFMLRMFAAVSLSITNGVILQSKTSWAVLQSTRDSKKPRHGWLRSGKVSQHMLSRQKEKSCESSGKFEKNPVNFHLSYVVCWECELLDPGSLPSLRGRTFPGEQGRAKKLAESERLWAAHVIKTAFRVLERVQTALLISSIRNFG